MCQNDSYNSTFFYVQNYSLKAQGKTTCHQHLGMLTQLTIPVVLSSFQGSSTMLINTFNIIIL